MKIEELEALLNLYNIRVNHSVFNSTLDHKSTWDFYNYSLRVRRHNFIEIDYKYNVMSVTTDDPEDSALVLINNSTIESVQEILEKIIERLDVTYYAN